MKTWISILAVTICIAFGSATWATSSTPNPTLKIGDPAPALQSIAWLQGTPVTKFEPGRVYVVEFWATWCPPCIEQIPHLSAVQAKYANTVTVISVNADGLLDHDAKAEVVHDFMNQHGKNMAYTVAMEDPIKKTLSKAWVTASGSMGAPVAFIVDPRGKLVWIGYPDRVQDYGLDRALEDTLAGKADLARARALQSTTSQETANYYANLNKPKHK